MPSALTILGVLAGALFVLAGAYGGVRWWLVTPDRAFWWVLRAAQGAYLAFLGATGVWVIGGGRPEDDLFYVYALTPVLVSFLGEQLRVASAQAVLDARGLPDARAVGGLDEAGQRSVVVAILRREMGVLALAALVCAALLSRAVL